MMNEKYEKIELPIGSTIEQAVDLLFQYKNKGELVYVEFNGTSLYSDVVTIDSAYREITGKSKTEFVEHIS